MNNIPKVTTSTDDLEEDEDDYCICEDGAIRSRGPGNTCGTDGLCVRHKREPTR